MVARSGSFFCSVFRSAYCLLLYSAPPSLSLLIPNFLFPFQQFLFAEKQMEHRRVSGFSFAVSLPSSILSSLFLWFSFFYALSFCVFHPLLLFFCSLFFAAFVPVKTFTVEKMNPCSPFFPFFPLISLLFYAFFSLSFSAIFLAASC